MSSPFICSDRKETFHHSKPVSVLIDRKIVMKTVITGYEDGDRDKPIGSMIPSVVEEKTSMRDLLDKDKDQCGVVNIIRRISKTGDLSLLKQRVGYEGDFSELPQSIAEVQAKALSAEILYSQLPDDMKKGLSLKEFTSVMDDAAIASYFQSKIDSLKKEEKEGE